MPSDAERGTASSFSMTHEARLRPELPEVSAELLAMVRYITAADGPLQSPPEPTRSPSPWQKRLLLKAAERLESIDGYLRGRVAFFVAAKDRGYGFFEGDGELAGAALETCRATTLVVEALLAGRLPTEREFEAMSDSALRIYPVLETI